MKRRVLSCVTLLIMFIGIGLLAYPTFSNWINELHATRAVKAYNDVVNSMSEEEISAIIQEAIDFNKELVSLPNRWKMPNEMLSRYYDILDISGSGLIGQIIVPSIDVTLPIYHGTSDDVLQVATGLVEGSTFPIGGPNTHAVISGHTGLPSAVLFTNLDKVEIGETFIIKVLNKQFIYDVKEINVVKPNEMKYLALEKDKDLVTLLTCTPYGVNSHRLLVKGERVEILEEEVKEVVELTENSWLSTIKLDYLLLFISVIGVSGIISIAIIKFGKKRNKK